MVRVPPKGPSSHLEIPQAGRGLTSVATPHGLVQSLESYTYGSPHLLGTGVAYPSLLYPEAEFDQSSGVGAEPSFTHMHAR